MLTFTLISAQGSCVLHDLWVYILKPLCWQVCLCKLQKQMSLWVSLVFCDIGLFLQNNDSNLCPLCTTSVACKFDGSHLPSDHKLLLLRSEVKTAFPLLP